jgi:hypothetical protein
LEIDEDLYSNVHVLRDTALLVEEELVVSLCFDGVLVFVSTPTFLMVA